jgi:AcrR family transcriptional regulator
MQAIAKRVGVSRQTVYNTFQGRDGLAEALIEHLTDSFIDGFDAAFAAGEHAADRWAAGVRYLMERARDDPSLRAMLGLDSQHQFLELLTSGSAPIVTRARERIPAMALRYEPDLDRRKLTQVSELLARLLLSEAVQPLIDLDEAMTTVTQMVTAYLGLTSGK